MTGSPLVTIVYAFLYSVCSWNQILDQAEAERETNEKLTSDMKLL